MDSYDDVFICTKCDKMRKIKNQAPILCKDCSLNVDISKLKSLCETCKNTTCKGMVGTGPHMKIKYIVHECEGFTEPISIKEPIYYARF